MTATRTEHDDFALTMLFGVLGFALSFVSQWLVGSATQTQPAKQPPCTRRSPQHSAEFRAICGAK